MDRPFEINPYVNVACLPNTEETYVGQHQISTGWGTLSYEGAASFTLMEVETDIISDEFCRDSTVVNVHDTNICANKADKGPCQGDSGGPNVVMGGDGKWSIVGITSFGIKCGQATEPDINTRVSKYIPWIVSKVNAE